MFKALIEASVRFRWFVVLATAIVAAFGLYNLTQLPIDAVPDITNRQVQINTIAPALAPEQMERQVTYPLETAMAGIPGIQTTRSLSRNGFSQVRSSSPTTRTSTSPASRWPNGWPRRANGCPKAWSRRLRPSPRDWARC